MTQSYELQTAQYRSTVEELLTQTLQKFQSEPAQLHDAMAYSLLGGGKRLRAIFCLEFCRMTCGDWHRAAPFAAALEMIHAYSLIHDDLPCMDNDDFRRGKPTNHRIYGDAMALLAGDALLSDAFAVAAAAETLEPQARAFAVSVLAECIGSMGMVGGQALDMLSEERACTEQEVLQIQSRKTGALINAACVLGVIAGGGSERQIAAAGQFAGLVGLAFQIRDDMLDVIGKAAELGKATGVDAEKNTFVRLYGLEKCEELVQNYTSSAVQCLREGFPDAEYLTELAQSLVSRAC